MAAEGSKHGRAGQNHCVYILSCADDTLYTGYTARLNERVELHNAGKGAKYTRSRLPVRLIYSESFPDKPSALRREIELKKLKRSEKLKLIEEGLPPEGCNTRDP